MGMAGGRGCRGRSSCRPHYLGGVAMIADPTTKVPVMGSVCNCCALIDLFIRFGDEVSLEDGRHTDGVRVNVSGEFVVWLDSLSNECTCATTQEISQ